jgi:hypothetical protein
MQQCSLVPPLLSLVLPPLLITLCSLTLLLSLVCGYRFSEVEYEWIDVENKKTEDFGSWKEFVSSLRANKMREEKKLKKECNVCV